MNLFKPQDRTLADRGMDAVDAATHQLARQTRQVSERTVAYIHDEPLKATLIAVAAGGLLAGIVCALSRRR